MSSRRNPLLSGAGPDSELLDEVLKIVYDKSQSPIKRGRP